MSLRDTIGKLEVGRSYFLEGRSQKGGFGRNPRTPPPPPWSWAWLLLSYPSHNVLPLAGACLCPLCHCGQVVSRTGHSDRAGKGMHPQVGEHCVKDTTEETRPVTTGEGGGGSGVVRKKGGSDETPEPPPPLPRGYGPGDGQT